MSGIGVSEESYAGGPPYDGQPPDVAIALQRTAALTCANPPPAAEQQYDLFDAKDGRCRPLLPVQRSVDRFTFVDLIALTRSKRPLTLPLNRTFAMDQLRQIGEPIRGALAAEAPLLERPVARREEDL